MSDAITSVLILLGGVFGVLGAVGLLRMPDVLIRMHASTKIGTLACGLIVIAAAVHFGSADITIRAVAILLFLLLTAPIAAHMIGRAAVSTGVALWNTRQPPSTTPRPKETR
ncbi:multicomponent Na+:H+ antiporter subunit G [Rhodovulum iodosum]|uniref:Multicomponent Na+:H+ antiporter subunit G n=1 Tax=Rhodovulum iodosum TaxID=68291 RepID=A0ABV3XWI4_9RHOB|nr:monovalent cation/H(+) antiporter subunit G [Rhodovulum robiginosum]RSK32128.1 monovalent cation/H(+) antiporter subunit G [Rhodovulum robiginosum]